MPKSATKIIVSGLLAAALAIGGAARAFHLGAVGLSPDEAASWAAASGRDLTSVVHSQAMLNPGKLALSDLMLHAWIGLFGDGTATMRSLSALIGVGAILLVFWTGREIAALDGAPPDDAAGVTIAALSALIFAITLVMIKYEREARMYSLMLAAVLAQTGCLLRARRRGGLVSHLGIALFTAMAIAANFTAGAVFAAQAAWLAFAPPLPGEDGPRARVTPLCAMAAGGLLLAPILFPALMSGVRVLDAGALGWIGPAHFYDPVSLFNKGAGTLPFPPLLALSIWGVVAGWRRMRAAVIFALFWMLGPVVLLLAVSKLLKPMLTERYVLSSFVPWFFLAALGLYYCRPRALQWLAFALLVVLSIAHTVAFLRKPPHYPWAFAARQIAAYGGDRTVVVVSPDYAASVIRYQLRGSDCRIIGLRAVADCAAARVMVNWVHLLNGPQEAGATACAGEFPHLLFHEGDLSVMGR